MDSLCSKRSSLTSVTHVLPLADYTCSVHTDGTDCAMKFVINVNLTNQIGRSPSDRQVCFVFPSMR